MITFCPEVAYAKGALKNFVKYTGRRPDGNLFFNKVEKPTP